jgi:hypothetical protein
MCTDLPLQCTDERIRKYPKGLTSRSSELCVACLKHFVDGQCLRETPETLGHFMAAQKQEPMKTNDSMAQVIA